MITSVTFLILVATVPLLGGKLSRLGTIRLRAWWTIVASLVIQVFLIEVFAGSFGGVVSATIHLLSYGLAIMFVWHNRHVVGMGIMVFGGMLNLVAIAANGGVMPAQLDALETAGIITDSPEFENSAPVEDAKLWFLGDIFAIPQGIPFANVFSVGDVILVLGGGITAHMVGGSRLGRLLSRRLPGLDASVGETGVDVAPLDRPAHEPIAGDALADLQRRAAAFDQLEAMAEHMGTSPAAIAQRALIDELGRERDQVRAELNELERMRVSYHRELRRLAMQVEAAAGTAPTVRDVPTE